MGAIFKSHRATASSSTNDISTRCCRCVVVSSGLRSASVELTAQAGQAYHCFCSVDAGAELIASETAQSIRRGELAPRTLPPRAATTVGYVCQDRKCSALTDEEIKKRLDAGDAHVVRFLVRSCPRLSFVSLTNTQSRGSIFLHNDLTLSEHTVQQATDPLRDTERDDVVLRIGEKGYTRLWSDVVDDHELEIEIVMRDEVLRINLM